MGLFKIFFDSFKKKRMDDISNPQTSKDNTKRKKRCAWFRLWMLSNTNPDSVMKWGKERRRNNQDEKTGIGTGTCVRLCDVQWFPISLCYTLYYPSFDSPFFHLITTTGACFFDRSPIFPSFYTFIFSPFFVFSEWILCDNDVVDSRPMSRRNTHY